MKSLWFQRATGLALVLSLVSIDIPTMAFGVGGEISTDPGFSLLQEAIPGALLWVRESFGVRIASLVRHAWPRGWRLKRAEFFQPQWAGPFSFPLFPLVSFAENENPMSSSSSPDEADWHDALVHELITVSKLSEKGDISGAFRVVDALWRGRVPGVPRLSELESNRKDRRDIENRWLALDYLNEKWQTLVSDQLSFVNDPIARAERLSGSFLMLRHDVQKPALQHLEFAVSKRLKEIYYSKLPSDIDQGAALFVAFYAFNEFINSDNPQRAELSEISSKNLNKIRRELGERFGFYREPLLEAAYVRAANAEKRYGLLREFLQDSHIAKRIFWETATDLGTLPFLVEAWARLFALNPDGILEMMMSERLVLNKSIYNFQKVFEELSESLTEESKRHHGLLELRALIEALRAGSFGPWISVHDPGLLQINLEPLKPLSFRARGPFVLLSRDGSRWTVWHDSNLGWRASLLTNEFKVIHYAEPGLTNLQDVRLEISHYPVRHMITLEETSNENQWRLLMAPPLFVSSPQVQVIQNDRDFFDKARKEWYARPEREHVAVKGAVLFDGRIVDPALASGSDAYIQIELSWDSGNLDYLFTWPDGQPDGSIFTGPVPAQWIPPVLMNALRIYGAMPKVETYNPLGIGKYESEDYRALRKLGKHGLADKFAADLIPPRETVRYFKGPLETMIPYVDSLRSGDPVETADRVIEGLVDFFMTDHSKGFFRRKSKAKTLTAKQTAALRSTVEGWVAPLKRSLASFLRNEAGGRSWNEWSAHAILFITVNHESYNRNRLGFFNRRPLAIAA